MTEQIGPEVKTLGTFLGGIQPNEEWTEEEGTVLAVLLHKLAAKNGWVPDQALLAFHQSTNVYAPELMIADGGKIFLCQYDAGVEAFKGLWHIPGGYTRPMETLQETCSRIAKREIGVDVKMGAVLAVEKWDNGEHPWGSRPLSAFTACTPTEPITETKGRLFYIDELPEKMVPRHRDFIRRQYGATLHDC